MSVKSSEAKRQLVLTVSAEVFSLNGYARTTMGDLAKAAGMSRPALYLVFPRKEQLFSTLLREAADSQAPPLDGSGRGYGQLVSWLLWACSLWTGRDRPGGASHIEPCSQHEKYSEYVLIESLLCEGIDSRLPLSDAGAATADVARLIATCMRGLSEIPLSEAERQRLLSLQVDAIATSAGWTSGLGSGAPSAAKLKLM